MRIVSAPLRLATPTTAAPPVTGPACWPVIVVKGRVVPPPFGVGFVLPAVLAPPLAPVCAWFVTALESTAVGPDEFVSVGVVPLAPFASAPFASLPIG